VRAALRDGLRFEHWSVQELVAQLQPGSVDAFLFRNVAVYFAPRAVASIYEAMATALSDGGLLCVAATDPQPAVATLTALDAPSGVYRRCDPAPEPRPPANPPSPPPPARVTSLPAPDPRQLADAGRIDEALVALETRGAPGLGDAARHLLRGQILLSAGRVPGAREALRRALYLEPDHLVARYWLALTLTRARDVPGALAQVRELERQLRTRDDADLLEDGQGTVRELRAELGRVREQLT
jgi:tetratricopeptide (TPR) repeat protein